MHWGVWVFSPFICVECGFGVVFYDWFMRVTGFLGVHVYEDIKRQFCVNVDVVGLD